jgi:hypothetical protein
MKVVASPAIQFIRGNGFPMKHRRVLPNDPCPCGSKKKAKHCCGTGTDFFYSKLTDKQLEEVKKKHEAEQKEPVLDQKEPVLEQK